MSMQLFSFGHPCEHQLRRTCIGGSSCPLNGYPDLWCCSYIKGKINFKRDKPCEGARCRWGFTHPTQAQFDAVTQVLNESRPIATKIDEAGEKDLLSFHIDNQHIVDTVQCALHMMRHPPGSCARCVGQLIAYAAVKSGDAKVFMQILKTMKKPVDSYLLGAYAYLTQGNPPTPNQPPTAKGKKGEKNKKEDVVEDLKSDLVDLMNAALSQGGHLVDREDQHALQATLILALRQYPKSNKKRQEMLEAALAKFGDRQMPKDTPSQKESPAPTPEAAAAAAAATPQRSPAAKPAVKAEAPSATAALPAAPAAAAATTAAAAATPAAATTPAAAKEETAPVSAADVVRRKEAAAAAATPAAVAAPPAATTAAAAAAPPPPPPAPKQPVVGISKVAQLRPPGPPPATYVPIHTDEPLPHVLILGGQFALNPNGAPGAPLGAASCVVKPVIDLNNNNGAADAFHVMDNNNVNAMGGAGGNALFTDTNVFGTFSTDAAVFDTEQFFKDYVWKS